MENAIIFLIIVSIINLIINLETRINILKKRKKSNLRRVLLDTSVLIDGRILDLAKTGFISDELVISRSVMGELQLLADGKDSEKRTRARFGLDVISQLQKIETITVTIWPDARKTPEGVDDRLLYLAKENDFALATIDYNLNKVAKVEDIVVLNMNELAKAIKTNILPGEKIELKLIQTGQSPDQAVGYLEDGAMVVVAKAKQYIGQTKKIEIKRYLQTDAGKMIFAELDKSAQSNKPIKKIADKITKIATKNKAKKTTKKSNNQKTNKRKASPKRAGRTNKTNSKKKASTKKPLTHKQRQDKYLENIINSSK